MGSTAAYSLQELLWPELGVSTERDLYVKFEGSAALSGTKPCVNFGPGDYADFGTSANLFNLGKWRRHCGLKTLALRLEGVGRFELAVSQSTLERSEDCIFKGQVALAEGTPVSVDLSALLRPDAVGTVEFSLRALGEGRLDAAIWETRDAPRRTPSLTLSITTFKREAAVQASVARFERFMEGSALAPHLHLLVVDNGRSAEIAPSDHVTPIGNENLGGSGGFARGLLEAEARGATHCLFMDDDAAVQMGALERVWTFLAYAEDDRVAISGGMTMANERAMVWESGATFRSSCRPHWMGTDLRDREDVLKMELGSTGPKPHNFYGGWWFFAFPIAHARYKPFPFFVRGDDVSFSLANDFDIVTLPGVICFQDADFSDKESLQTLYLDLRSHLIHHLALPSMDIGLKGTLRIAAWFFARSMMQAHYESLKALNLAIEDVLRGPQFFAENADMVARRAAIGALRKNEAWRPLNEPPPASRRRFDPRKSRAWRMLMKYSLNGHLLPFFSLWGNRVTLKSGQRGALRDVWGAARITYVSIDGRESFTVRHSKLAALREGLRMLRNEITLARRYPELKDEWRKGYEALASTAFWSERFAHEHSQTTAAEREADEA
ncbi:glycosyltransferase family 2 protein [Thioclava sp. BHET1]|nr:glycosyltransferase family 2 protein [Thioclava sp. BHET1]